MFASAFSFHQAFAFCASWTGWSSNFPIASTVFNTLSKSSIDKSRAVRQLNCKPMTDTHPSSGRQYLGSLSAAFLVFFQKSQCVADFNYPAEQTLPKTDLAIFPHFTWALSWKLALLNNYLLPTSSAGPPGHHCTIGPVGA